MVVILGAGSLHDALIAAAMRGHGVRARACAPPDDRARDLARQLLPRGHTATTHALVASLLADARAHGSDDEPAEYIVPGDRCGGYASDLRRALRGAGLVDAVVYALAPERGPSMALPEALRRACGPALWLSLLRAVATGDALERAHARLVCAGLSAPSARAAVEVCLVELLDALERRRALFGPLRRSSLARLLALHPEEPAVRARVAGELVPSRAEYGLSVAVFERLARPGLLVEATDTCAWLLYALHRARLDPALGGRLSALVHRAHAAALRALGLSRVALVDARASAAALRELFPVRHCAGSGHLELASFIDAERAGVGLFVSLKAFSSSTSSAVSDALLHAMARRSGTVFVALELDGQALAQLESRVALAVETALERARSAAPTGHDLPSKSPTRGEPMR